MNNKDTILIKYKVDEEISKEKIFKEDEFYEIKIVHMLLTFIKAFNSGEQWDYVNDFLKSIDGKIVLAKYKGISRIDGNLIFLLSENQIKRDLKLNSIL